MLAQAKKAELAHEQRIKSSPQEQLTKHNRFCKIEIKDKTTTTGIDIKAI